MPKLVDIYRVIKVARNWWNLIPVTMGVWNQTVIEFRNGLRFNYSHQLFSIEHFLEQPYRIADVKNRVVVDIGAFSGDSAIFFAWRGALKVYAFEPVPAAFKMAVSNLELNGIQNVKMFNEAVGFSEGEFAIKEGETGCPSFSPLAHASQEPKGQRIRVRSFEALVGELKPENAVLKMDCEGCEYEILLRIKDELLLPFAQIILEYHNGADNLLNRLAEAGYETCPLDVRGNVLALPTHPIGLLYAKRTGN